MSAFEVIVRGATVVAAAGPDRLDAGVLDGRIAGLAEAEDPLCRHRVSPYVGRTPGARVVRAPARGRTVYAAGRVVAPPAGRHLTPDRVEDRRP